MAEVQNVIFSYTDRQALEDGVLVAMAGEGRVNRVTRTVFDHFARTMGESPVTGQVFDIGPLREAVRAMRGLAPDADGWRTGEYQGKRLWLIPNEVAGLTLMFPEDY